MQIIKVLATDSTNTALRKLYRENPDRENCCFAADFQKKGKGQRGSNWQAKAYQNLTFSVLMNNLNLSLENRFKLSMITAVSIIETLKEYDIPELSVKWPNDILSGNHKIAGILIENVLSGPQIKASVIGIGLNVNQEVFRLGLKAASLASKTGKNFSLDKLLNKLSAQLEQKIGEQVHLDFKKIEEGYYKNLFQYQKGSEFLLPDGFKKQGVIDSVSAEGKLKVIFPEGIQSFDIKEIKLLY
jgi:BirA family biotin operon repressor/biotin-[acetyl-CoA-carboxylase] ligase